MFLCWQQQRCVYFCDTAMCCVNSPSPQKPKDAAPGFWPGTQRFYPGVEALFCSRNLLCAAPFWPNIYCRPKSQDQDFAQAAQTRDSTYTHTRPTYIHTHIYYTQWHTHTDLHIYEYSHERSLPRPNTRSLRRHKARPRWARVRVRDMASQLRFVLWQILLLLATPRIMQTQI